MISKRVRNTPASLVKSMLVSVRRYVSLAVPIEKLETRLHTSSGEIAKCGH
jgi:hypothetical protein